MLLLYPFLIRMLPDGQEGFKPEVETFFRSCDWNITKQVYQSETNEVSKGSRKKSLFFNGSAIKALTPPPIELNYSRNFANRKSFKK